MKMELLKVTGLIVVVFGAFYGITAFIEWQRLRARPKTPIHFEACTYDGGVNSTLGRYRSSPRPSDHRLSGVP